MDSIFKEIILREAQELINKIKDNEEYNSLVQDLKYFVNLQGEQMKYYMNCNL